MDIEEIPKRIGIKRSIALLGALLFIAGTCLGYSFGYEDANQQIESRLEYHVLHSERLAHVGNHYYRIYAANYSDLDSMILNKTYGVALNDSINRTP